MGPEVIPQEVILYSYNSLYDIQMRICPPQSVRDKVHCHSIGPAKLCGDYLCTITTIHTNAANVWKQAPVSPENVTVTSEIFLKT